MKPSIRRLALALTALACLRTGAAHAASAAPVNEIEAENCLPGTPRGVWDVGGAPSSGDPEIQGFATDISVERGGTIGFKVASAADYGITIYRMGYYGGLGARETAAFGPITAQAQPYPIDCSYRFWAENHNPLTPSCCHQTSIAHRIHLPVSTNEFVH